MRERRWKILHNLRLDSFSHFISVDTKSTHMNLCFLVHDHSNFYTWLTNICTPINWINFAQFLLPISSRNLPIFLIVPFDPSLIGNNQTIPTTEAMWTEKAVFLYLIPFFTLSAPRTTITCIRKFSYSVMSSEATDVNKVFVLSSIVTCVVVWIL